MDCASGVIKIDGCLTDQSCTALFSLIRRLQGLSRGVAVTVDLSGAKHIESRGLESLQLLSRGEPVGTAIFDVPFQGTVNIIVPPELPRCPASIVRGPLGRVAA
ncbi:hypothetical protein AC20117_07155 [Arthrobacter crystallopoietes]|nr:hypothetical protein AC20117_07155 [Arthrobacter crystallopoietes]